MSSNLIVIAFLFYALGKAADAVVINLRRIGERLGLHLYFLGFVLGAFTTLPELAVGMNAIINDIPSVSLGNLFGGVMVLFGLILGTSVILNRSIKTDTRSYGLAAVCAYMLAPLALSLDGALSMWDGILLIGSYVILLLALYRYKSRGRQRKGSYADTVASFFWVALGMVLIVLLSNLIVRTTLALLSGSGIPMFVVGLLVYALGTNLPEISVTFRSWKRKSRDLSLSSLLGSAMANVAVVGVLAFVSPLDVAMDSSFVIMAFFLMLLMGAVYYYGRSGGRLVRREGAVLVGVYVVFVLMQVWWLGIM